MPADARPDAARQSVTGHHLRNRRDIIGGAALAAIGVFLGVIGARYQLGTLFQMGAGFFPVVVSTILAGIGLALILLSSRQPADESADEDAPRFDALSATAILASIVVFGLTVRHIGLVPATFLLVGTAALAERRARLWRTLILAVMLSAVAVFLFSMALGIRIPAFRWPL